MKTVAITGRSGCGKSTVAEYYRNRGFPVLDGDAIAREVTQPGSPCLTALAAAFGADILDEAGCAAACLPGAPLPQKKMPAA